MLLFQFFIAYGNATTHNEVLPSPVNPVHLTLIVFFFLLSVCSLLATCYFFKFKIFSVTGNNENGNNEDN
jgi:hypothetical protein